jgi:hypothetical protein
MFSAITNHSGRIKALFEVLFSNTTTVCLTISKSGICSETSTTNNTLICVQLPASCFDEYTFTFDEPQHIGLGSHINGFFKSLKNKTRIILAMTNPCTLDISTEDDGCAIAYSAAVICAQNILPAPTYIYDNSGIAISCANFNAMCKSFSKSNSLDVLKKDGQLAFSFELVGIASRTLTFGEKEKSASELYYQQFKSDAFVRIGKLASFAETIRLFVQPNSPLLVEANSVLGVVKVYMN